MIVDCAVYEDGRRREAPLPLEDAREAGERPGSFVWIDLHEPSAQEFEAVRREFDLHELAVEDAIKAHQRPKVERYGETMFVVLKTVAFRDREEVVDVGEVMLFVADDFVISVRHGAAPELAAAHATVEQRHDFVRCGSSAVLYAILDDVVDGYRPALEEVLVDVDEVEDAVFSSGRVNPAPRIYKLGRELLEFHRAVAPLAPVVERLAERAPDELRTYFRDVHDHVLRVADQLDATRDILTAALQANLTQVSVRQNEDMRRISAWVAILAVPTMVAGIYGMNFEHMPELKWRFGYPLVLALIALVCALLYRRFRRAGWL